MSASTRKVAAPEIELSGLNRFLVSDLMEVEAPQDNSTGKPLELPLDQVAEDPQQVRSEGNPGFSAESLAELAASIVESGGVKTPISVRSKNADGVHVVNHGARRLRASRMAGLATIRAFIDDNHDEYDQAIENIQRESFTAMEIARFIERREQQGDTRSAIAKRLGKSNAFVTQHASLLTLPGDLREAYDDGRCRDVLTLYELNKFSKQYPDAVTDFIRSAPEITRGAAEAFRQSVKRPTPDPVIPARERQDARESVKAPKAASATRLSILVRHEGALYALRADLVPSIPERGWIEQPGTSGPREVDLSELQLYSIVSS
jgi:ParB family transcriptional regulator, chromosome partitioning protein